MRADRRNGLNTSFIFLRHFRAHLLYGSYWLSSLGSTSCYNKTANLRHGTGGKDRPVAKEEMKAICWIVFNLMGFFFLLSSIISCLGSLPAWVYHVLGVVYTGSTRTTYLESFEIPDTLYCTSVYLTLPSKNQINQSTTQWTWPIAMRPSTWLHSYVDPLVVGWCKHHQHLSMARYLSVYYKSITEDRSHWQATIRMEAY